MGHCLVPVCIAYRQPEYIDLGQQNSMFSLDPKWSENIPPPRRFHFCVVSFYFFVLPDICFVSHLNIKRKRTHIASQLSFWTRATPLTSLKKVECFKPRDKKYSEKLQRQVDSAKRRLSWIHSILFAQSRAQHLPIFVEEGDFCAIQGRVVCIIQLQTTRVDAYLGR